MRGGTDVSPIFVREGAALPSAPVISPLQGGHWQELSINLYGLSETAFTLYEDDGETEDYLDGIFRKTEISVSGEGDAFCVHFGAADGKFNTDYTTRLVTLRIHSDRPVKGAVKIEKDASARPFAHAGGSRIADVYEITAAVDLAIGASIPVELI